MHKPIPGLLALVVSGVAACRVSAQTPTLTGTDVGSPANPGSMTTVGDKITIVGGGNDVWNNSDNFYYAYFEVTGDFDYVVKLERLVGNSGDGGWSKAELMARQDDGAGFNPQGGDPHLSNMTTRQSSDTANGAPAGVNYRGPQWRAIRDNASSWTAPNPGFPPNMPDNWMRLERIGSVFYMYTSNDGQNWSMFNPYSPQGWDTAGSWPPGTDNASVSVFREAWPAKIMLGLAVTAHNDGATTEAVFSYFQPWAPVPIQLMTQPPATLNIAANSHVEIKVEATGDPIHYIWRKDGTPVPTNGLGATYTIPLANVSDSGTYTVRLYGGGAEVISSPCVLIVTQDTTAPTIAKAKGSDSFTGTTVTFSEPVSDSALVAANYRFVQGITISSVVRKDQFAVVLTHSRMAENTVYQLTVNNVQDTASPPNTIVASSTINVHSYAFKTGVVLHKFWDNVTQNNIAGLEDDPRFPDNPTFITIEPRYEYGPDGGNESGSNYGNQLIAWFIPPETGNYVFFTCSDDPSNLYLSTDDNPANKKLIAQETGWSNARQWLAIGSGDVSSKRSDQFANTEWPDRNVIYLTANRKYYLESTHTEGSGGDNVGATFIMEGDADPANGSAPAFAGNVIGSYVDPTSLPPLLIAPTTNTAVTLAPNQSSTFTMAAEGATRYRWQLNGRDIADATSASYTIASAQVTDTGQYWAFAINDNGSVRSALINVLVTATGVFNIEAEDFDYDGGQSRDEASFMPYKGGAYEGLTALWGIDYHNDDDPANNQVDGHPVYRYGGDLSATGRNATMGNETPGGQFASTRMGEWTMTTNYKIGWVGSGNWGNYTRSFPTPAREYYVFATGSYDGTGPNQLDGTLGIVTAGVGTANQSVQTLGRFNAPGTGGWSRNNVVAMTDDVGAIKTVQIGGTNTVRWTYNSGDADNLAFVPVTQGEAQSEALVAFNDLSTTVYIVFGVPVDPAIAATVSNYEISDGVRVLSASCLGNQVMLTTTALTHGHVYSVSHSNLKDLAGNPIPDAALQVEAQLFIIDSIRLVRSDVVIEWSNNGVLQEAPAVTGPWTDLPAARSPYQIPLFGGLGQHSPGLHGPRPAAGFYRLTVGYGLTKTLKAFQATSFASRILPQRGPGCLNLWFTVPFTTTGTWCLEPLADGTLAAVVMVSGSNLRLVSPVPGSPNCFRVTNAPGINYLVGVTVCSAKRPPTTLFWTRTKP